MRRKDREMDKDFALTIIDKASYAVAAMTGIDGTPYAVPLSVVRQNNFLYFHSATSGRKVGILELNKSLCITFVGENKVPENFADEELESMKVDEKKAGALISKVFTTEFESAMVFGDAELLTNDADKIEALRLICQKYTPSKMEFFDLAIQGGLSRTNVYRVHIKDITAKRKKFDDHGEEMKGGQTL